MQTVTVKNVTFGEGQPKICVPIVARTPEEVFIQAKEIVKLQADLCEWRVDWFDGLDDAHALDQTACTLREALPEMPLLFTCRTKAEGGERKFSPEEYLKICEQLMTLESCDLIDIELFTAGEHAPILVEKAHKKNIPVIFSSHDFNATPSEEEIINRLKKMEALGGDLLKIAVMPQTPADVLTLLSATTKMNKTSSRPLITMSMGALGAISRICGEMFGSCMTFGSAKLASAPGQIPAVELRRMLELLRQ